MFIDDFVWLTEVANKLAIKHRVTQDEVEEVFFNNPRYRFVELGYRSSSQIFG
jgi:hypothetical protein